MKIKDIEVGGEYAFVRSAIDEDNPDRVRVTGIHHNVGAWSERSNSYTRTTKILVQRIDENGEPTHYEIRVVPSQIKRTWADELTVRGQREVARKVQQQRENARIAQQQAEIDHMISLVPAQAWEKTRDGLGRPLEFKPGLTPRISVENLTLLLKAARTAALNEAFEEES